MTDWRDIKRTPLRLFNGTACGARWAVSTQAAITELTEAEYDATIARAAAGLL